MTIPDWYPLPNIADFTSRISGATVFSKLDLQKGYYLVPMTSKDIQKNAIITPFGMFEFLRIPFGLGNTGNTFPHGLTIGLPKCEFAVSKIKFLGHLLSASGCSPLLKHSAAISAFHLPSDKPALQRFLGMLNFYWKFLRGAAGVLAPLTDTLKGPGKSLT